MKFLFRTRFRDAGYLVLRFGAGFLLAVGHGWGKISGGPARWATVGEAMQNFGLDFLPLLWGFMGSFAEFFGSLLVMVGLFTRPAAFLIICTMGTAATGHVLSGDGWFGHGAAEMSLLFGCIYLMFLIVGPGKYSLDSALSSS